MQLILNLRLTCSVLLAALASNADAAKLHESNSRADVSFLGRQADALMVSQPGHGTGGTFGDHKARVMDAIHRFRAKICANLKEEHKKAFASFEACQKYMEEACHPGGDKEMDGDKKEISSGRGYCKEYFPEAEKKAEEEVSKKEKEETDEAAKAGESAPAAGPGPAPAPGGMPPGVAPAPAPAKEEKSAPPAAAPAAADGGKAPAPAPSSSPVGSPGPAPVPSPFIPGISKGKPWGPIPGDEKYYYKDGGKDISRLHMDEGSKLPTNGYWGKLVEHDDGQTATGDWGREFGPKSGHASFDSVCRDHPDNPWCYRQGLGRRHRSGSPVASASVALTVLAFLALGAL